MVIIPPLKPGGIEGNARAVEVVVVNVKMRRFENAEIKVPVFGFISAKVLSRSRDKGKGKQETEQKGCRAHRTKLPVHVDGRVGHFLADGGL